MRSIDSKLNHEPYRWLATVLNELIAGFSLALLLAIAVFAPPLDAQTTSGSITGVVGDL
jgi:hypothetical protein